MQMGTERTCLWIVSLSGGWDWLLGALWYSGKACFDGWTVSPVGVGQNVGTATCSLVSLINR